MARSPSPARQGALEILSAVLEGGSFASEALDIYIQSQSLRPEDRRLVTQLVYGVLRSKGVLDHILFPLVRKNSPNFLLNALRMGSYQLLSLERVPDHAVLHETVEMVKRKGGEALAGVVNAVLRKVQTQSQSLIKNIQSDPWVPYLYPGWLWDRWEGRYGFKKALELGRAFHQTPALWARVSPTTEISSLEKELGTALPQAPQGLPLRRLPAQAFGRIQDWVRRGWISLQDPGSFQIVWRLDPQAQEKGLDVCAGHGGKTTAIAEMLGPEADLWAYDISKDKLKDLKENFKRLALKAPEILLENRENSGGSWDWILLDAPCSGLGTLGRKPEIRWRVQPTDITRHASRQQGLLKQWAPRVKVGGRILYSVCSLEPEEGVQVVETFIRQTEGWEIGEQGMIWPGTLGADGFFWARLHRIN